MNIYCGTVLVHAFNPSATDLGSNGHRRVIWIDLLYHCGDVVHGLPYGRTIAGVKAFHLVANSPKENGRMIFVTQYGLTRLFELLGDLSLVVVIKAVSFVAEPDADRYRQSKVMCLVKKIIDVVGTPGTNRIRAGVR